MSQICVIVPVYKVEQYIHRCVDSILSQTFTDFDLVLVDDGSPDNCGVICDEYAKEDTRIVVIHQKNGGLSAARNTGLDWMYENSDSEWIAFIDSDDWIHPRYLEALYNGAKDNNVDVCACEFQRTEKDDPFVDEEFLSAEMWETEKFYLERNVTATVAWGKIYKRHCFEAMRYPVGKLHEDEFVTYKILFEYEKIALVDQPLYAYFVNENGIMGKLNVCYNIDALFALYNQMMFFRKKKQGLIVQNRVAFALMLLGSAISRAKEQDRVFLKKISRKCIKLKANKNTSFYKKYVFLYEFAYPKMMYIYWSVKGIKNKVLKRSKK